jgi:hypothetical protein
VTSVRWVLTLLLTSTLHYKGNKSKGMVKECVLCGKEEEDGEIILLLRLESTRLLLGTKSKAFP